MTWGIPTQFFLQLHLVLSLLGIATGLVALIAMIRGRHLPSWAFAFLATTFLTGVAGFPLAPFGIDPPQIVGIILLCVLAGATAALYVFALAGASRALYVVCATASLYLNAFVAIAQSFQKIPALHALAPTQSESPFAVAQAVALIAFVVLRILAWQRFRPPFTALTATA